MPIQAVRSGLRGVTFGIGYDGTLELRFMPVNADHPERRPAGHLRHRRHLSAGPAGGGCVEHRAQRRLRLCPHHLHTGRRREQLRPGADRVERGRSCRKTRSRPTRPGPKAKKTRKGAADLAAFRAVRQQPPQEILLPVKTRYIAVTLLVALVLDLFALPGFLAADPARLHRADADLLGGLPSAPGRIPAGVVPRLIMDVADGSLFGQHALAYAVLMYLAILLHRRIVMFGMRHQIVHVSGDPCRLPADHAGVRLMAGADFPNVLYFAPSLVGALAWPPLFNVIRVPLRPRADPDAV